VWLPHVTLLSGDAGIRQIADAIVKVASHAKELA
jgi:hypothetical protein